MSSIEELMQYAKGSQCACYVCSTLRKMLVAQLYAQLNEMKQQLKDLETVKEDSAITVANISEITKNHHAHTKY